jgi:dolichol kinase
VTASGVRRLLHASTAAVVLLAPLVSWFVLRAVVLGVAAGAVLFEMMRLRVPSVGRRIHRLVPVYRDRESARPSGAMWLAVGYALAVLLPAPASAGGIVVGAVADPAASWLGSLGSVNGPKTWRGSLAHFVVAAAALATLGFPVASVLAGATVGTALERWPGALDDNLLIAPGVALTLMLSL